MRCVRTGAVLLTLVAVAGVARADVPPTPADLRQLIDDGHPAAAVAGANRLVNATGDAAAGVDRAAAYAVKGEAHLRLRQYRQSADAFDRAAALAGDPAVAAADHAAAVLVRQSHNGTYAAKQPAADGSRPAPVDVVTTTDRTAAFGLLFADQFAAAAGKLRAAKTAHNLPDLLAAAQTAADLRQLEVAATGSDEKTRPAVAAVADHAHGLIETSVADMAKRVAEIGKAANATTTYYGRPDTPYSRTGNAQQVRRTRKVGLTRRNVSELTDIQATCGRVGPAADAFAKATADATDGAGANWEAVSTAAAHAASQAADVLNADYGNGLNDPR